MHVQIAGKLERGNALRAVHENDDRGEQIGERQLAAREDRAARHTELVMAGNALEAAARGDVVGLGAIATRTHSLAIVLRPTHFAQRLARDRKSVVWGKGV